MTKGSVSRWTLTVGGASVSGATRVPPAPRRWSYVAVGWSVTMGEYVEVVGCVSVLQGGAERSVGVKRSVAVTDPVGMEGPV